MMKRTILLISLFQVILSVSVSVKCYSATQAAVSTSLNTIPDFNLEFCNGFCAEDIAKYNLKSEWYNQDVILINQIRFAKMTDMTDKTAIFRNMATMNFIKAPYVASTEYGGYMRKATLPAYKYMREGDQYFVPMSGTSNDYNVTMRTICGGIAFKISQNVLPSVNMIELSSDNRAMSGTYTADANGKIKLDQPFNTANTIILDYGREGVRLGEKDKTFFIALPPGTYEGLHIAIYSGLTEKFLTIRQKVTIEKDKVFCLENAKWEGPTVIDITDQDGSYESALALMRRCPVEMTMLTVRSHSRNVSIRFNLSEDGAKPVSITGFYQEFNPKSKKYGQFFIQKNDGYHYVLQKKEAGIDNLFYIAAPTNVKMTIWNGRNIKLYAPEILKPSEKYDVTTAKGVYFDNGRLAHPFVQLWNGGPLWSVVPMEAKAQKGTGQQENNEKIVGKWGARMCDKAELITLFNLDNLDYTKVEANPDRSLIIVEGILSGFEGNKLNFGILKSNKGSIWCDFHTKHYGEDMYWYIQWVWESKDSHKLVKMPQWERRQDKTNPKCWLWPVWDCVPAD